MKHKMVIVALVLMLALGSMVMADGKPVDKHTQVVGFIFDTAKPAYQTPFLPGTPCTLIIKLACDPKVTFVKG